MQQKYSGAFVFEWLGVSEDVSCFMHGCYVQRAQRIGEEWRVSERIREQFQRSRREGWKRPCSVCGTATIRLDGLCYRHKSARVRNGHELQHAIKIPQIRLSYGEKSVTA
jgi:hypothetical protein